MANEVKISLKNLGFKDNEIKVYLSLTALGEANAATIAKRADIPRTTAISILEKLEDNQYLTTHKYRGTTYYWIESPQALINIYENKISIAKELDTLLTEEYRSEAHFPYAKFYDTKSGIRQFMTRFLNKMDKGSLIQTIDMPSIGNYSRISSSENFRKTMVEIKLKRKIKTRTLIPEGTYTEEIIKKTNSQIIELRELPKEIAYEASFWLTQKTLVHFSGHPPFLTAIKHDKIIKSQQSIFDYLWSISKKAN